VNDDLTLCTFRLGDWHCGLPIADVECAISDAVLTPIPLTPPHIAGLTNVHGTVATVINLPELFIPGRSHSTAPDAVILRGLSDHVGVTVDALGDVVPVTASISAVPDDAPELLRQSVVGMRQDGKGLVYCELSVDAILDMAESNAATE
jgi:purine-binding chemotaxis protein CheW